MTIKGNMIDMDAMIDQLGRPDLGGCRVCFDSQKYEIVVVSNEVIRAVADSDIEQIASLPEWKKELVETAENIIFYEKERYLDIPESLVCRTRHLMAEFVNSLPEGELGKELNVVLEFDSPVEAFEKVLFDYPDDKEQWDNFSDSNLKEALATWLKGIKSP